MSNMHYAVVIIGALSLLLGLGLGQIYYQHQRIEQLEFNRFRQPSHLEQLRHCRNDLCRHRHFRQSQEATERARINAERKLKESIRRYNKELKRWEAEEKRRSSRDGVYRIVE